MKLGTSPDGCLQAFDEPLAWFDSLSRCRSLGGDLANIPNATVEKDVSGEPASLRLGLDKSRRYFGACRSLSVLVMFP